MRTYVNYINLLIFKLLPETKAFGFKRILLRGAGVKIGANSRVCSSVRIMGNGELIIGENTWIGPETMIISSSKIYIGSNVDIGPRVYIGTGTHVIDVKSKNIAGAGLNRDIKIGNGCWIGVSSTILPGVFLKDKIIVAAGAVVNMSWSSLNIIGGIPAKKIKNLKNEN